MHYIIQNINPGTYTIMISYVGFRVYRKKITLSNGESIKKDIEILKAKKEEAQPTKIKTSGSTFKNPINQTEKKVWQLIKESVPLDKSFGDASISEKHCNFFINKNKARRGARPPRPSSGSARRASGCTRNSARPRPRRRSDWRRSA